VRLLLLFLLGLNMAFFAWARWIDVPPPVTGTVREPIPPLELAGVPSAPAANAAAPSTTAPPSAAAAPSVPVQGSPAGTAAPASGTAPATVAAVTATLPAAGSASAAGPRCRSVGPFEDLNAANVVADRLRSRGFAPRPRSADSSNPNVYWVYIGELTTDAQRRAIQALSAAGIHDAVSMTAPEQSDRVSVGVFADQAHAVKRAEQVRALGFKPTLGMRQRNLTLRWLDFDVGATDAEPSAAQLIGVTPKPAPGVGPVKVVDCPTPEAG
jgi:hypothetical protein